MENFNIAAGLVDTLCNLMITLAIFRLVMIDRKLGKIADAIAKADKHRRDEFNAVNGSGEA